MAEFPPSIAAALALAHPSWQPTLHVGLKAVQQAQPDYLPSLAASDFLPTQQRLFAAFALPLNSVRFVLFGEGPYPREQSATGVCFMDGAVHELWRPGVGLSKQVNRATSLRNFMKMLLVADGQLDSRSTTGPALTAVANRACQSHSGMIQTGAELQHNLLRHGFLLLNASLVFRSQVAPAIDAKAWLPFLCSVLQTLQQQGHEQVRLVLWGKIAEKIAQLPEASHFAAMTSEHPYNISFIANPVMQELFKPFHLLYR